MNYDSLNPTTEGRPCPWVSSCPGTTKGCVFWRKQHVVQDGKELIIENCLFILQFETSCQQVVEEIRTQASLNSFRNQVHVDNVGTILQQLSRDRIKEVGE